VAPVTLQWEFPLWKATDLDPGLVRGRLTKTEQRQNDRDQDGMAKVLAALHEAKQASARELRMGTGLSKERLDRLLVQLISAGKAHAKQVTKKGGQAWLYTPA
jgi:predicted HTH transcriptional regulator